MQQPQEKTEPTQGPPFSPKPSVSSHPQSLNLLISQNKYVSLSNPEDEMEHSPELIPHVVELIIPSSNETTSSFLPPINPEITPPPSLKKEIYSQNLRKMTQNSRSQKLTQKKSVVDPISKEGKQQQIKKKNLEDKKQWKKFSKKNQGILEIKEAQIP
jgi:hypothetical protein